MDSKIWLHSSAISLFLMYVSAIRDFTIQENGTGCQVATAVIERIETSLIFINHNFILNRLSFVFEFGKSTEYEGNGMFFITEVMVERVNTVVQNLGIDTRIVEVFCVDFTTITYEKMTIAINAGLAIMILLQEKENLPLRYDIEGQAKLLAEIYGYSVSSEFYLNYVKYAKEFDKYPIGDHCMQCKPQGTDLIFMIDASGSIDNKEWEYQKKFVMNFAKMQDLGKGDDQMRIGFVYYASKATKAPFSFIFDAMKARHTDMLGAIEYSLASYDKENFQTYPGYAFNAAQTFILKGKKKGSRIDDDSIKKVLVVLTDGKATDRSNLEKYYTEFRNKVPQYTIYAIGTTTDANMEELLYMTDNNTERAKKYTSYEEFSKDVESIIQMTCKSYAYVPIKDTSQGNKGENNGGPYVVNKKYKFKYSIKVKTKVYKWQYYSVTYDPGSIINMKMTSKKTTLKVYYSFSSVHASAQYNDFSVTVKPGKQSSTLLKPPNTFLMDTCVYPTAAPVVSPKRITKTTTDAVFIPKTTTTTTRTTTASPTPAPASGCTSDCTNVVISIIPVVVVPSKKTSKDSKATLSTTTTGRATTTKTAVATKAPTTTVPTTTTTTTSSTTTTTTTKSTTTTTSTKSQPPATSSSYPVTTSSSGSSNDGNSSKGIGEPDIPGIKDPGHGNVSETGEGVDDTVCDQQCQNDNPPDEINMDSVIGDDSAEVFPVNESNGILAEQVKTNYLAGMRFAMSQQVKASILIACIALINQIKNM